jgi:hypothetical protein
MPSPTIEQIEAEIRAAQFQQSETEAYLSRRSRRALVKERIGAAKDGTVAWAFREGVKQGRRDAKFIGVALGFLTLGLLVFVLLLSA